MLHFYWALELKVKIPTQANQQPWETYRHQALYYKAKVISQRNNMWTAHYHKNNYRYICVWTRHTLVYAGNYRCISYNLIFIHIHVFTSTSIIYAKKKCTKNLFTLKDNFFGNLFFSKYILYMLDNGDAFLQKNNEEQFQGFSMSLWLNSMHNKSIFLHFYNLCDKIFVRV